MRGNFNDISILSHKNFKQSIQNVRAVLYRREYQFNFGNIAHADIILAIDWDKLSEEESFFV